MQSEPYKIKEVKKLKILKPYERWDVLKKTHFNTFHIGSEHITFDMVAQGMSGWSHHQKSAYMIGDEAYAGSRNFIRLEKTVREVLHIEGLVPTHNGIGAEKLLATTMVDKGNLVLHNRGCKSGLVEYKGGESQDVTRNGEGLDLAKIEELLGKKVQKIPYIHIETCPSHWNGQPISFVDLELLKHLSLTHEVPLVVDISNIIENSYWIQKEELPNQTIFEIAHTIIGMADVLLMDASQDARADIGGFIASPHSELFETFRNQVVVFEGLHTYGGMTGRAMEVFAVGLEEMQQEGYVHWYMEQIDDLYQRLKERGVLVYRGGKGVALDVADFLPHLSQSISSRFSYQGGLIL